MKFHFTPLSKWDQQLYSTMKLIKIITYKRKTNQDLNLIELKIMIAFELIPLARLVVISH